MGDVRGTFVTASGMVCEAVESVRCGVLFPEVFFIREFIMTKQIDIARTLEILKGESALEKLDRTKRVNETGNELNVES